MAKSKGDLSAAENQRLAMADLDAAEAAVLDANDRDNFNITMGKPIPPEFNNPPCGKEGHLCTDIAGNYAPTWYSLIIYRTHDYQQNPQPFPLERTWDIHLDTWCDVPPDVIESLKKAVETHHEVHRAPQDVERGIERPNKKTERRRFHSEHVKSA